LVAPSRLVSPLPRHHDLGAEIVPDHLDSGATTAHPRLLEALQDYLFDEPPSGWDDVFTMTHK